MVEKGQVPLMKEAHKWAEELDASLSLVYSEPLCRFVSDPETRLSQK